MYARTHGRTHAYTHTHTHTHARTHARTHAHTHTHTHTHTRRPTYRINDDIFVIAISKSSTEFMLCLLSQTRLKNTDYHRAMSTTVSDKTKEHTVPSCSVYTVSHMTKEHRVSDMTENRIS